MIDVERLRSIIDGQKWVFGRGLSKEDYAFMLAAHADGLVSHNGQAADPKGQFCLLLKGELALGQEPAWYARMSPREKATMEEPWKRTAEDYLAILSETDDFVAEEYDNIELISDMLKAGKIALRDDKTSRHTSMGTAIYLTATAN